MSSLGLLYNQNTLCYGSLLWYGNFALFGSIPVFLKEKGFCFCIIIFLFVRYLIIRNSLPNETIGDLRNLVDHVFKNPSGLMKKAKEVNFCGFLVSPHRHILSYRHIAYNLPFAAIAKTLMDTSSIVFGNDIFHGN